MPATATPPRASLGNKPSARPAGAPRASGSQAGQDFGKAPGAVARPPVLSTVLLMAAGIGLTVYGAKKDLLLAEIAAPLLTVGAIHGLWRGGFRKVLLLAATMGALYVAFAGAGAVEPPLRAVAGSSSNLIAGLIGVAAAILLYVFAARIVGRMRRRFIACGSGRLAMDRLFGTVVGLAEAAVIVLALCWTAVMIRPHALLVRDHPDAAAGSGQQRLAAGLVQLADESQVEPIGRIVRATNMIERIPQLKAAFAELNETGHFDLEHIDPAVAARLNQVIPQMSNGQFQNLDQLLEAYRHSAELQDAVKKQLPLAGERKSLPSGGQRGQ